MERTTLDRLIDAHAALAPAEREVLALIGDRFAAAQKKYGIMNPATDSRNLPAETLEEVADGLVYVTAALVKAGGAR